MFCKINWRNVIIRNLFILLLTYRLINSFLLHTIFEPDEIWQNIEPISYILYGKGHITWDWITGIRSINFLILYLIPRIFFKDNFYCVWKIINALLATLTDYFTIKLYLLYHNQIGNILFITLFSHGLWLYSPRSHINSFEMMISIMVFYFYSRFCESKFSIKNQNKKNNKQIHNYYFMICVFLMTYITYLRPSVAFLLGLIFIENIKTTMKYLHIICITGGILIFTDCYLYKELIIPPINFYKLNLFYKISDLFGKQPIWSYLVFIFVLAGLLPLVSIKNIILEHKNYKDYNKLISSKDKKTDFFIKKLKRYQFYKKIALCCLIYFIFYSMIGHKEMRFILPLIPFINILSAKLLNTKLRFLLIFQFIFVIFIGLTHQRYYGVMKYLEKLEGSPKILYAICPYSLPAYSFSSKLNIDIISGDPDIYSKTIPRMYEKFGTEIKINEYAKFINDQYKTFAFDKYDYVLLYDWSYKKMIKHLQNFNVVKSFRYSFIHIEKEKGRYIYILKRL